MLGRFCFSTRDERKVFDHEFLEVLVFFLASCTWFLAHQECLQVGQELALGSFQAGRIEAWVDPVPGQVGQGCGDHAIILRFFGIEQIDHQFRSRRVPLATSGVGGRLSVDTSGNDGRDDAGRWVIGFAFVVLRKDLFDLPHEHAVVLGEHLGRLLSSAFDQFDVGEYVGAGTVHRLGAGLCKSRENAALVVGFDPGDVERLGLEFLVFLFELCIVAQRRIEILGAVGRCWGFLAIGSLADPRGEQSGGS